MSFSSLNYFDYALIAIIAISFLRGLHRGCFREFISLVTWVAAFYCAMTFSPMFFQAVGKIVHHPDTVSVISFSVIFLSILALGILLNYIISSIIGFAGLGLLNRFIGGILGLARGIFISLLIVIFLMHSLWQKSDWFQESQLSAHLQKVAVWGQAEFKFPLLTKPEDGETKN